jgi:hypothetical protein
MASYQTGLKVHRRRFFQSAVAATAGFGLSPSFFGEMRPVNAGTVRDRLWLFSNPRNADYDMLRKRSVMSPFEAAAYMGIPNLFMVQQYPEAGQEEMYRQIGYQPFEPPFEQYMVPLTLLKRVACSLTGAGGVPKDWERKQVLEIALETPNFVGVYLDDFFYDKPGSEVTSLTVDQLRDVQRQIKGPRKKMDIYVTFYAHQLNLPITEHLKQIDVIALWMWKPEELANVDSYLTRLNKLAPQCRIMLGVYTTAFNENKTPGWTGMPVPLMQKQCEQALGWLRSGRIEGIIIYGGTTFDLGFESVDWTREWIRKVGETKI